MELLYLWIDNDYKTIKNQSFNFSNHIEFTFKRTSKLNGKLFLKENPNYIENFFDESSSLLKSDEEIKLNGGIVNITGIIGKNGVGKTNLINFIIDVLTERNPLKGDLIIAFKDRENKSIKIFHTIQKLKLSTVGSIKGFKVEKPILQIITTNDYYPLKVPPAFVNNTNLIYYNPAFDLRDYPENVSNELKSYIDISTNALIDHDVFNRGDSFPEDIKQVELYKYSNVRRQFEFVLNAHLADLGEVNLPSEVKIIFHRKHFYPNQNKRNLTSESEKIFEKLDQLIVDAFGKVNATLNIYQSEGDKNKHFQDALKEKLKVEFCYSFIHNYFNNLNGNYLDDIGLEFKEIKGDSLIEKTKYFFENQRWAGRGNSNYVQTANLFNSVIKDIDEIDFENQQVYDNANHFITQVPNGHVILSNYINYLASLPLEYKINFISTSWRNISSGENALMDLYSRLYFAKEYRLNTKFDDKVINNPFLYLIFDEGELGFHPQWQKEYLSNVINFVSQLFAEYKVQIIITSHSPFLVSDLPKENIILLDKDKETGLCKVVDQDVLGQTFGANIHSLFKESFFLENGTMGEFAKLQIIDLINFLKYNPKKEESENNIKPSKTWLPGNAKKLISMIGEPLIKNQLQDMWDENFIDEEEVKKSIKELAREVSYLKFELNLKIKENETDKIK